MEVRTTYDERWRIAKALVKALRERPEDFEISEFWLDDRKTDVAYWIANGQMFLRARMRNQRATACEFMIGPCCKDVRLFSVASVYAWWHVKKFIKANRSRSRADVEELIRKVSP